MITFLTAGYLVLKCVLVALLIANEVKKTDLTVRSHLCGDFSFSRSR